MNLAVSIAISLCLTWLLGRHVHHQEGRITELESRVADLEDQP